MAMYHEQPRIVSLAGIIACAVLALICPLTSNAEEATATAGETAVALSKPSVNKHEIALKSLRPERGPIRLMGIQNSVQVNFPVSARQRLSDVDLTLYVTNSIALNDRSHMAVAVNGVVIGQLPFRAQHPETRAHIAIPAELLQAGYNQLTFNVAQHATENCEDPASPELWSEIDTTRSTLSYHITPQPIKPTLAELPQLMDKRLLGHYTLTIATAGRFDASLIEAGGLVAQTAALSRDYASLGIRHAKVPAPAKGSKAAHAIAALPDELFADGDGVLLGSRDELAPWLDKKTYARAAEPLLAIFPFGAQGERFVLLVTGADNAQVWQAARTLVQAYTTLPPTAQVNIREMGAVTAKARPTLQPATRYAFADFDFTTATRQGIHPQEMMIRFWVPADHFAYPNSKLTLSLHLAYGAGFGAQSVLNVFLNNHFEHAVRLAEPLGGVFYDYRVSVPINSLVPGWNELQFRPLLVPQRAEGRCQPIYTENLLLTLFDDSSLESADMMQLTELPDLALFGRTAFPFAGGRHNGPLQLALTGHERGTVEAAWTMLGKLAQINSAPLLEIHAVAPEKANGNTLLVGQLDKVPAQLLKLSPLHTAGGGPGTEAEGMLAREQDIGSSLKASLRKQLDRLMAGDWWLWGRAHAAADNLSQLKASSDAHTALKNSLGNLLDNSVLLSQFQSPARNGDSVVMVVANSVELLSQQVTTLVDAPYWGQLKGGSVILGRDSKTVRHYTSPETYLVGNAGLKARLSHLFAQSPSLVISVVAGGILLFALLTWRVLVGYRRRQHEVRAG